jgi:PIN domain
VRTNYVLIDYENVQPTALTVLEQEHFKVIVFVGANQAKISFDVASAIQRMGTNASYIKISGNGPNALDFHIAFYVGQLSAAEPKEKTFGKSFRI